MKDIYLHITDLLILLSDSSYSSSWPLLTFGGKKHQYRFYFPRTRTLTDPPDWADCCTTFPQLRDTFGQIFAAWREKREAFGPGFYLYLGARRGMKLYVEHRFVNLVWGVESLHRKTSTQRSSDPDADERVGRILKGVLDAKDRKWLEGKLKYANEPTLEQRIFECFGQLPLSLESKKLRRFATECARLRNEISHYGGQREPGNYRAFLVTVDKVSVALSYLYHAVLLQEIGVHEELLRTWVYKSVRSYEIKRAFVETGLLPASAANSA